MFHSTQESPPQIFKLLTIDLAARGQVSEKNLHLPSVDAFLVLKVETFLAGAKFILLTFMCSYPFASSRASIDKAIPFAAWARTKILIGFEITMFTVRLAFGAHE